MADTKELEATGHVEHVETPMAKDEELRGWVGLNSDARAASDEEKKMGVMSALRMYPKAALWSVVISMVVIMDGYDTALMGSLTGFPAFQQRFGVPQAGKPGSYQLQAKWILALNLGSPCGNIIGIVSKFGMPERCPKHILLTRI